MKPPQPRVAKFSFTKTFLLPALLVFLVPIVSLAFFSHAQATFDARMRDSILSQIRSDSKMSEIERRQAIAFFEATPISSLMDNEEFAATVNAETRFHYTTFRWMVRLSALSILSGVVVFLLAGLCVLLSLRSQLVQYLSLSVGWHVLRIYGALQALVQGVLLVALSFWVTALWFNVYIPKLIFVIGLLVLVAVAAVIAAIFKKPHSDFVVQGKVLEKDTSMPLWDELKEICAKVGTAQPDQVIAGIDDNFFVTEQPVIVDGKTYRGRTLFVSLSLLKQLQGAEADAVLAHEMAHFSGQDTVYSKKIAPLLLRYDNYLQALHDGVVTLPIYYFMLCFRAFYQLSLGRLSRQREFRADRIAVETMSPHNLAGALLRVAAYSKYRIRVEDELFRQEQALEAANVSERIEKGFHEYAARFAAEPEIGNLATAHPFDSHPPLSQRLEAIGVPLESDAAQALLASVGDGRWHRNIAAAEQMERDQWREFEERFRIYHEQTLPFRFIPETVEEQAIVVRLFPPIAFESKEGRLAMDFEKIEYAKWPEPLFYREILNCVYGEDKILKINYERAGKHTNNLNMMKFVGNQQEVIDAFNRYYTRYLAAVAYQTDKKRLAWDS